jgi:transposase-like protein
MKRKRHTSEQIIRKLREAERLKAEGQTIAQICQQLEVSEQTYHRWKNTYGGMSEDQAKRLKETEQENARLKKLLADAHLDMDIMRAAMREK